MGRGIVESGLFRSERVQFELRTTDPTNTKEGEAWIRTDIAPNTNQLATLRFDGGASTFDMPIFDSAASVTNVEKVWPIPIGGTVGFIPLAAAGESGAYPQVKYQHGGNVLDGHDRLEVRSIPDSGILHEWPISDTTSPVPDAQGNADISLTGTTFDTSTDSWWDGHALSHDGVDDISTVSANRTDPGDSGTIIMTVNWQNLPDNGSAYAFSHPGTTNDNRLYVIYDGSIENDYEFWVGDSRILPSNPPSVGVTERIAITWDSGSFEAFIDGNSQGTSTYSGSVSMTTENWYFGGTDVGSGTQELGDVIIDYPRIWDVVFTDQEISDDYSQQPWSP